VDKNSFYLEVITVEHHFNGLSYNGYSVNTESFLVMAESLLICVIV